MNDNEKTIKGLCEALAVMETNVPKRYWGYSVEAIKDAIALLKAQAPVKAVYSRQYEQDPDIQIYKCGACGKEISAFGFANYCQHCGRKVKWE